MNPVSQDKIFLCPPTVQNNISSTVVRSQLVKGQSVKYLIPDRVRFFFYSWRSRVFL